MREVQLFVAGEWTDGASTTPLTDKYDGRTLAKVHEADSEQVTKALDALATAQASTSWTHYERYVALNRTADLIAERAAEFETAIVDDTGFTIGDAQREVSRTIQTVTLCAEEAKRIHGDVVPLHGAPGHTGRLAFTVRHPRGVVCAITPFNSPLNTVAHKVGPALAAGNAVILKPASLTPLSARLLIEVLLEAGVPEGRLALVFGRGTTVGQWLLESSVPAFYAFTGSTSVGEHIRRTVGLRPSQLELGSLSSTIVCADASVEQAVNACVGAAFRKAGQVCTSVQRLYVQSPVMPEFRAALTAELVTRQYGDPRGEGTFVGPVISPGEAERIEAWVGAAVAAGADCDAGGTRTGQVIAPTVLSGVDPKSDVLAKEVFGPVVSLVPFDELDQAIDAANDTPYGLAAGVFTRDVGKALDAADRLRMGSIHINETSSSRVDLMPYGGVKESGMGVEGPRYAIEEMTEQRLVSIGRPT